ncbi:MAG: FKBP-type peptidyl-prolyl cis-trans isomerase [Candidatus Sumerlaeaceae bacterium]
MPRLVKLFLFATIGCTICATAQAQTTSTQVETTAPQSVDDAQTSVSTATAPLAAPAVEQASPVTTAPAAATASAPIAQASAAAGTSVTLTSGVSYKDLVIGTGAEPTSTSELAVHYTLRLQNGKVADSSRTRLIPTPFKFTPGAGKTIPGMDEGVGGMRLGGRRLITIPPSQGYGAKGSGSVPPNATLEFDVELVGIK